LLSGPMIHERTVASQATLRMFQVFGQARR
jgi:hypothetical protein